MKAELDIRPISLPHRAMHRIDNGRGTQVFCLKGPVWITQEGDPRDIILSAGQSFLLDRKGVAVVFALREAAITVGAPGHVSTLDTPRWAA